MIHTTSVQFRMNGKVILTCRCHTPKNSDLSRPEFNRWNVFDRIVRPVNFILNFLDGHRL